MNEKQVKYALVLVFVCAAVSLVVCAIDLRIKNDLLILAKDAEAKLERVQQWSPEGNDTSGPVRGRVLHRILVDDDAGMEAGNGATQTQGSAQEDGWFVVS